MSSGERLHDFVVGLMNDAPSVTTPHLGNVEICGHGPSITPYGATLIVVCSVDTLPARYVIVLLNHQGVLTVCELEVFGTGTAQLVTIDSIYVR